jgi:excisionase family DNA binding protein
MKSILEAEDIQSIADAVAARLNTTLPPAIGEKDQDEIFDVPGLAVYLKVDNSWVYKQVQYKAIPHFHVGRYPRFRKSVIDKWTKENATPAAGAMYQPGKLKKAA